MSLPSYTLPSCLHIHHVAKAFHRFTQTCNEHCRASKTNVTLLMYVVGATFHTNITHLQRSPFLTTHRSDTASASMLIPGKCTDSVNDGSFSRLAGGAVPAPRTISRTDGRSATGEAAFERSRRDASKAYLKFCLKGHSSGQGQVKGQNCRFSLRLPLKPFHLTKRVENHKQCVQLIDEGDGSVFLLL